MELLFNSGYLIKHLDSICPPLLQYLQKPLLDFLKALLAYKLLLEVILASSDINLEINLVISILAISLANSSYFLEAIVLKELGKPLNIRLAIIGLGNS